MTLSEHLMSEMPLVFFTILAQAVVGLALVWSADYITQKKPIVALKPFGKFFGISMCVAMIPALFHLNDLSHIFSFLNRMGMFYVNGEWHIGWMNNEVLFLGLACVAGFLLHKKQQIRTLYALLACGVLGIFFMAGTYGSMQESVPTWSFSITMLYFFSTVIFLGALCYQCFFATDVYERKMAFLTGLVGIGLLSASIVLQTLHVGSVWVIGILNPFELLHGTYPLFIIGSMACIGLGIVAWYAHNYLHDRIALKSLAYIALGASFLGVFLTRILFYGLISTQVMLG